MEMASKLTFIKHNLMLQHVELFKKERLFDEYEQGTEEDDIVGSNIFVQNDTSCFSEGE